MASVPADIVSTIILPLYSKPMAMKKPLRVRVTISFNFLCR